MKRVDLVEVLKNRQNGRTLREFAEEIGCSAPYLSDIYNGRRAPGPTILRYLGVKRIASPEVWYEWDRPPRR